MDQRILPTETIKFILSFLNDKDARIARLVNTDWFQWIKYAKFNVYFATSTLLPQIVDRLSTYQYPIELSLHKPYKILDSDILAHVPKLTQLKAFYCSGLKSNMIKTDPQEYLKLSTLTNLEKLSFGNDRHLSPELLQHFPRMRQCDSVADTKELIQIVNTHCPHYQSMTVKDDLLSVLPGSVTELSVTVSAKSLETLTRLTKLKKLNIFFEKECSPIEMQHVTWLEHLMVKTLEITGLEHGLQLTELEISDSTPNDASALLESLKSLPKLTKLKMFVLNCQQVTFPDLPHLTHLYLSCVSADTASLPTTLQELEFDVKSPAYELTNISHLVHLTKLDTRNCTTAAIEPLGNLTKLKELRLMTNSKKCVSFSTLHNLTYLFLMNVDVDPQTVKSLTNLQHWHTFSSGTEQATIDNLEYLSHLTHLSFQCQNEQVSFDYKVIEKLPLAHLKVHMKQVKNCWTVLPTLTSLESLTIEFVEEEQNLASLERFSKLTKLEVMKVADNVKCVYLTRLTNLQDLHVDFQNDFSYNEFSSKLTRLQSVYGIKQKFFF